jgi:hypothetical protein
VFVSTTCEAFAVRNITSLFCHAQQQMRVGHFEKQQHDRHAHKRIRDHTLSERNVLEKLLRFSMNKENALSRRGT